MDRMDRVLTLHKELISRRHPVSRQVLEQKLECSGPTVKRTIGMLRDYFSIPVTYDRVKKGYFIDRHAGEFEIPGLWLNPNEIHAMLVADSLLTNLEPGLVRLETAPFRHRLRTLMDRLGGSTEQYHRIRLLLMGRRRDQSRFFPRVAHAVLQRKRLQIRYRNRHSDRTAERLVSPQRLTHYRDNWYLDAWCHERKKLLTFSLDRIEAAKTLEQTAIDMGNEELNRELASAYGIFSGMADKTAVLLFTPRRARWVANETWHPEQISHWRNDGSYELHLPYLDPTELIGDILKYADEVEVLSPGPLRQQIAALIETMRKKYKK